MLEKLNFGCQKFYMENPEGCRMKKSTVDKMDDFNSMLRFREEIGRHMYPEIASKGYGKFAFMICQLEMMKDFGFELDKSNEEFIAEMQKKGFCQIKIIDKNLNQRRR